MVAKVKIAGAELAVARTVVRRSTQGLSAKEQFLGASPCVCSYLV
jgi:hypothetical protein